MTDAIWRDFCAAMEALGDIVTRNADNPVDRAEGYRYLTRLLRGGLEAVVEATDATHPVVATLPNQLKIGADNPDNLYQTIGIDGRYEYRIAGRRNTVHYLGFGAYGGGGSAGASSGARAGYLEDHQLEIAADGTFEIVCSAQPHAGSWLPLLADTRQIIVRQSYLDRHRERPAELAVECISGGGPYPVLDDVGRLRTALLGAVGYAASTATTFEGWTRGFMERPNELHQRPKGELATNWSDPNITFYHGYWALEPGQAVVV
jgi:hypothetical protein